MNMVLIETAIVNILLIIAMFFEKKTKEIPPLIGWLGCVAGILCSVLGDAICSWQEDLIAYVISYILILILYTKWNRFMGGGALKMLAMTSVYFGRYALVVFVMIFVSALIYIPFVVKRYKGGDVMAMPFVLVGSLTASVLVHFI